MLQGYGDAVLRAEALEEQLVKAWKHFAMLQSKLDGAFAQYHNEVQDMQAKSDELVWKNKSLRNKNKGTCCLVEYLLGVPCSSRTHLACELQSLRFVSSN
jgi:FtsZ-binding cell division protein ZapB